VNEPVRLIVRERLPVVQDPVLAMIERAARDPSVDIDKMERLLAIHREMRSETARTAYNAAMARVQAQIKPVYRDAMNDHTNSPYARLETISEAITPIITSEGFSLSYDTADCPVANHIRIVCDVMHSAGHTERKHFDLALDNVGAKGNLNKTAIQASGSTISYGRRYLKCMVFDVVLTNEDNDGNDPPPPKQDEIRGNALSEVDPQKAREMADKMLSALGIVGANPVDTDQRRAGRVMDLHDEIKGDNDLYIAASHLLPSKSRSAWKKYKAMAEELQQMEAESTPRR